MGMTRSTLHHSRVLKSLMVTAGLAMGVVALLSGEVLAKAAKEIDASVDVALERFYKQVPEARSLSEKARGILVMPDVIKGAFIVGGEYGEGALRVEGKTVDYYNLIAGSFGFQFGGEAKDIIIMFMTDEALQQFRASKGWEVGVDGNVALITLGGGKQVDFTKINDPIIGFVLDVKGLMVDVSLKGAKLTKIDKK
jgi:lipid-binding SYLF domain-containing protein